MLSKFVRFAGSQAAHQTLRKHTNTGGVLDLRFGMHLLLRDKSIPITSKLLALGLGSVLTWMLIGLELPLELFLGTLLPVIGFGVDAMIDGAEAIICPVLFAALMLPYLAPRQLVTVARSAQVERPALR